MISYTNTHLNEVHTSIQKIIFKIYNLNMFNTKVILNNLSWVRLIRTISGPNI